MSVSLEGSYGLKRSLADLKTTDIKTGEVVLVPYHVATKGSVTEFMRIEAPEDPMHSYSRDIPFERVTKLTLAVGSYFLSQYLARLGNDDPRPRKRQVIEVLPNRSVVVKIPVYLPEQRIKKIDAEYQRSIREYSMTQAIKKSNIEME